MPRKYYTIDDLYLFCKNNNFTKFSSQEKGAPLVIQSIETFESDDHTRDGFLDVKLKSCHIGKNRNQSAISEKTMKKHMNSFKGRPILGSIYKTDTGEFEFRSHDVEFTEDGMEYIEQPVGVISELKDPYLEYDKDNDKTYLMVEGHIFEDYSHAAEILQRRKTCKCSVELAVEEMSYNADEDYLSIDAFSFRGVTILGFEQDGVTEIQEGMEGSKITIDSFSAENNSMFSINYQDKLIETLEKLNDTLSSFNAINITNQEEVSEEMSHFDELLAKYGVELDAIDFEYESLSDEELDTIFEEHFGESSEEVVEESVEEEEVEEAFEEELTETEEVNTDEEFVDDESNTEFSLEDVVINFRISHEDIRYGLQNLLNNMNGDSHYYVVDSVYDKYFYYVDWMTPSMDAFKQNFKTRKDVLSFDGDAEPVYRDFVTQAERDELEKMRKNYSSLKEFKENYDAAALKAEKDAIFEREEFDVLSDNEAFAELKNDMDNFTVEEIESKAKQIFADYVISKGQFAMNKNEHKESKKIGFNFAEKPKKAQAYAGLFDE